MRAAQRIFSSGSAAGAAPVLHTHVVLSSTCVAAPQHTFHTINHPISLSSFCESALNMPTSAPSPACPCDLQAAASGQAGLPTGDTQEKATEKQEPVRKQAEETVRKDSKETAENDAREMVVSPLPPPGAQGLRRC